MRFLVPFLNPSAEEALNAPPLTIADAQKRCSYAGALGSAMLGKFVVPNFVPSLGKKRIAQYKSPERRNWGE